MNRTFKSVLTDKKGMADSLGMTLVAATMLVAVGIVVSNFGVLSKQSTQFQSLTQEITNRAELYVGQLNADLVNPQIPTMARQCSSAPAMCTVILSAVPSADGKLTVLRVQGDALSGVGQSVAKDITLVSKDVTHITGVDSNGKNIWSLSNEGLRYRIWELSEGEPGAVSPGDMTDYKPGTSWVSIADRAGIDSSGALWVWGANDAGQAGVGASSAAAVAPQKIPGTTSFRSVVTTEDRGYAIDAKGDAWVWGRNTTGQLGLGHTNAVNTPTRIAGERAMSFAAGKDNAFILGMDGSLSVVGASQPGFPANTGADRQKLNAGTKYTAVAASTSGAVATVDSDGTLEVKGASYPFTPGSVKFSSVSLGSTAGYGISISGDLYSWGTGSDGQLGLGAATSAGTPTQVMAGTKFVSVKGSKTSALAIDTAGRLYFMGKTVGGFTGGIVLQAKVPTALLTESRFRDIETNSGDSAAALLDTAGNVYGMGTATPGLWPMSFLGQNVQPIRMPTPSGFAPGEWR